jgi:hypothetical protein
MTTIRVSTIRHQVSGILNEWPTVFISLLFEYLDRPCMAVLSTVDTRTLRIDILPLFSSSSTSCIPMRTKELKWQMLGMIRPMLWYPTLDNSWWNCNSSANVISIDLSQEPRGYDGHDTGPHRISKYNRPSNSHSNGNGNGGLTIDRNWPSLPISCYDGASILIHQRYWYIMTNRMRRLFVLDYDIRKWYELSVPDGWGGSKQIYTALRFIATKGFLYVWSDYNVSLLPLRHHNDNDGQRDINSSGSKAPPLVPSWTPAK